MKFTVRQSEAIRAFAAWSPQFRALWRSERHLMRTYKIHRVTLEALVRLGIVERCIDENEDGHGRCSRLTPVALGIIAAMRSET